MRLQSKTRRYTPGHGRLASLFTAGWRRISNYWNLNASHLPSSYCTDHSANRLEVLDESLTGHSCGPFSIGGLRTDSKTRNPGQTCRKTGSACNEAVYGTENPVGRPRFARRLERCHKHAAAAPER